MDYTIEYATPEQQLNKLKSQNLTIENETETLKVLSLYGYSNIIKSYRYPYVYISDEHKVYRDGVSFDQIFSLYILDKNLRNAVMAAMLDLEEYIKEAVADVITKDFGTDPEDYLKYKNYQNKRKRIYQFTLPGILQTMRSALNTDKEPVHHYRTVYGTVPPWILFKSVYFSTIANFIDQLKAPQQSSLVEKIYDLSALNLSSVSARKLLIDTLFICLGYRNTAAHGGRIYNYQNDTRLRKNEIFGEDVKLNLHGFSQLIFLLKLMRYQSPYLYLKRVMDSELSRHCNKYPQDMTYLGQILNVNIVSRQIVYASQKSRKYHSNPHCSGISQSVAMDLSEAEANGYMPCKRCALISYQWHNLSIT